MQIYMLMYVYIYANINVYGSLYTHAHAPQSLLSFKAIVDAYARFSYAFHSLVACHSFPVQFSMAHSLQHLAKFTILLQHYSRTNTPNYVALYA